mgnify:CR=1 FL=1
MKRKVKRLLAMFLTFIMVFSMGTVFVSAAEEGTGKSTETAGKPELSKKTADSVVLKTKDGYVYGIQENGSKWKWAEDKQYDKTAKTVSFTGLKAETEYVFAGKTKDAETVQDTDTLKVKTEAAAVQTETPKTEEPPKAENTDNNGEINKPQGGDLNTEQTKPEETNKTDTETNTQPSVGETTGSTEGTQDIDKDTTKDTLTDNASEPKTDEPKVDEPKVDEPKADEPKVEEPKKDESKADDSNKDESKGVESKGEEQKTNSSENKVNDANGLKGSNNANDIPQKAEKPNPPAIDKVTDTSVVLKPSSDAKKYTYSYKLVPKDNKAKAG